RAPPPRPPRTLDPPISETAAQGTRHREGAPDRGEFPPPEFPVAILRPVDRRGVEVSADQERRMRIVSFAHVEKTRDLRLPLASRRPEPAPSASRRIMKGR